ncbi:MAG: glycosyltransferase [Planctomycetes bacterium]|nr:glycosyltransferase [Planctomycetota bacterium]
MAAGSVGGQPALDKWIVLGYPRHYIYHKHRLYNMGILAARGDICVICDSDAVFPPTFIASLLRAYTETPAAVVHLDEVRNTNQAFYPFNYPPIKILFGAGCINWEGHTTLGLNDSADRLHHANYGACMAARRRDLLAIGGADEHPDYLGYVCGPYELTFRLLNYGREERWLKNEYLYHTWHPNQYGLNQDHHGPHDGFHLSARALDARSRFRVQPYRRNPWIRQARWGGTLPVERLLQWVRERPEPDWEAAAQPPPPGEDVYWMEKNWFGFNIFQHADTWYALRVRSGMLNLQKLRRGGYHEFWQAPSKAELQGQLPLDLQDWERWWTRGWLPARLWRKFRAQPWQQLPRRLVRQARRLAASSGSSHGPAGVGLPRPGRTRASAGMLTPASLWETVGANSTRLPGTLLVER